MKMSDREPHVLRDGEFHLEYHLTRSRRRTIGIMVHSDGEVDIRVPKQVALRQVEAAIILKKGWIQKKLDAIRLSKRTRSKPPEFVDGEPLPYLGRTLTLAIQPGSQKRIKVRLNGDILDVIIPEQPPPKKGRRQTVRDAVISWFKEQARAILPSKIDALKVRLGVEPARITIKGQKTRWGSCSSIGNVNLNWRLILSPPWVLEYIIIHELCHIKHPNHSSEFWNLVESLVPNYKKCKQWLDSSSILRDF